MQRFNYHCHTYRCGHADLDMSDEEYVLEFIKMGFTKIAFTDHCPEKNKIDKRPEVRMEYGQKQEYLDSIQMLKQKYADKIEIQTGYEVEYLPGEEENIKELKQETDKIILGQHFIYDNNKPTEILTTDEFTTEEFWKIATKYNIKVLYGIDVHHRGQILLWNELIELAHEVLGKEIIEQLNFMK